MQILSFGFRYGDVPAADLVVNARSLRNPHHDRRLRALTGLDRPVRREVLSLQDSQRLLSRVVRQVSESGARSVAFGCTAGRHRSVVLAEELAARLREAGHEVEVLHRERELGRWS
jgi:UPF0042 nucleotide-binding protein